MNKIKINNVEIKKGYCQSQEARLILKDFPNLVVCDGFAFYNTDLIKNKNKDGSYKSTGFSLTHNQIIEYLNECLNFEITKEGLAIETQKYIFYVVVK